MSADTRPLHEIVNDLPPDLQQEVYDFARYLLHTKADPEAGARKSFYICPTCFETSAMPTECHGHVMIHCHADKPEDCKPLMNKAGHLSSRAPRWFKRAVENMQES